MLQLSWKLHILCHLHYLRNTTINKSEKAESREIGERRAEKEQKDRRRVRGDKRDRDRELPLLQTNVILSVSLIATVLELPVN